MSFCPNCNGPLVTEGRFPSFKLVCKSCQEEHRKEEWKKRMERIAEQMAEASEDNYYGADTD